MEVSVIIPTKDEFNFFLKTFNAVLNQSLLPKKIIIIDSSIDNKIKDHISNNSSNIKIIYKKLDQSFPGESRNFGVRYVDTELIAFLDSKTVPNKNWLNDFTNELKKKDADIHFGSTKYFYNNEFQKKIRAATFGSIAHITTPGTLIKTNIVKDDNYFIENVRTADDLEWRERLISKKYKYIFPHNYYLSYFSLPNSLIELLKRYFIYSFHTSIVDVQHNIKEKYLFIFLILSTLLIARWNFYIPGWDINHFLFISLNTKKFLFIFLFLIIFSLIIKIALYSTNISKILKNYLLVFFISLLIYSIYWWNAIIAEWVEKSSFYIPHITKIFISIIFIISFMIRGVVYPINRKITYKYLFPFNWIFIGLYGLSLDLVKTPGYLLGSMIPKFLMKKKKNIKKYIVFYTKYTDESASYRYRIKAYFNVLNEQNFHISVQKLFNHNFFLKKIFLDKLNYFSILKSYFIRLLDLIFRKKPFIAIIHIELLPFFPNIAEYILTIRKVPYIIDIDDAVYYRFLNSKFIFLNNFIQTKFKKMVSSSSGVFVGNNFHKNYFNEFSSNIHYFPTVIDLEIYNQHSLNRKHLNFSIVWVGTPSTCHYLNNISHELNKLKKNLSIDIYVIGAKKELIDNLDCQFIKWEEETYLKEISKCHIGIMPLNDSPWEEGKCGFKILQYMGLKLPVVASPYGVNKMIIRDNVNGLIARNKNDWYEKIQLLKSDRILYDKFVEAGYKTVTSEYNLKNFKEKYFNEVNKVYIAAYKN